VVKLIGGSKYKDLHPHPYCIYSPFLNFQISNLRSVQDSISNWVDFGDVVESRVFSCKTLCVCFGGVGRIIS
jgi:hypothetical protein